MPSTISNPTTKTTRVKQTLLRVAPGAAKELPANVAALRRRLKSLGAIRIAPEMKRRLIVAGEWGMPKE